MLQSLYNLQSQAPEQCFMEAAAGAQPALQRCLQQVIVQLQGAENASLRMTERNELSHPVLKLRRAKSRRDERRGTGRRRLRGNDARGHGRPGRGTNGAGRGATRSQAPRVAP